MKWTDLLKSEIEAAYRSTTGLMEMVDESNLDWKPETGSNWMTIGQLLMHLTTACGGTVRGFVTGDWGLPEGVKLEEMSPEEMLPQAEKMPAIASVAEAKRLLDEDRRIAIQMIEKAGEDRLTNEVSPAPWDPTPMSLGQRLMHMVEHLNNHKGQLFYYLKLQGKNVNTMHYYGMGPME